MVAEKWSSCLLSYQGAEKVKVVHHPIEYFVCHII